MNTDDTICSYTSFRHNLCASTFSSDLETSTSMGTWSPIFKVSSIKLSRKIHPFVSHALQERKLDWDSWSIVEVITIFHFCDGMTNHRRHPPDKRRYHMFISCRPYNLISSSYRHTFTFSYPTYTIVYGDNVAVETKLNAFECLSIQVRLHLLLCQIHSISDHKYSLSTNIRSMHRDTSLPFLTITTRRNNIHDHIHWNIMSWGILFF